MKIILRIRNYFSDEDFVTVAEDYLEDDVKGFEDFVEYFLFEAWFELFEVLGILNNLDVVLVLVAKEHPYSLH